MSGKDCGPEVFIETKVKGDTIAEAWNSQIKVKCPPTPRTRAHLRTQLPRVVRCTEKI